VQNTTLATNYYLHNLTKRSNGKRFENLSASEKKSCSNVDQIVGTERW
jgi:hypothetical protein